MNTDASIISNITEAPVPVKKVKKPRKAVKSEAAPPPAATDPVEEKPMDIDDETVVPPTEDVSSTTASKKRKHVENEEEEDDEVLKALVDMGENIKTFKASLKDVSAFIPLIKTKYNKIHKEYKKLKQQKTSRKTTKCGFSKPTPISDALCDFFKIPHGSSMSRSECTNQIKEYVIENNLYVGNDKRKFLVDDALEIILGTKEQRIAEYQKAFEKKCAELIAKGHEEKVKDHMDDIGAAGEVTYFKLQILLNKHIPKTKHVDAPTTATSSTSVETD